MQGCRNSKFYWNVKFFFFFFPLHFFKCAIPLPFKEPVRWAIIKDWQFPSRIKKIFFKNSLNRNTLLKNRHFQRMFFRLVHCKRNSLNQIIQTQPVPLFYFYLFIFFSSTKEEGQYFLLYAFIHIRQEKEEVGGWKQERKKKTAIVS